MRARSLVLLLLPATVNMRALPGGFEVTSRSLSDKSSEAGKLGLGAAKPGAEKENPGADQRKSSSAGGAARQPDGNLRKFKEGDTDQDHKLSTDELRHMGVSHSVLSSLDKDGDHQLSMKEYTAKPPKTSEALNHDSQGTSLAEARLPSPHAASPRSRATGQVPVWAFMAALAAFGVTAAMVIVVSLVALKYRRVYGQAQVPHTQLTEMPEVMMVETPMPQPQHIGTAVQER